MAYDPVYYKQYYEQRKADILAARGERYRTDERYREGILRRARVASVVKTLTRRKQRDAARVVHAGKSEKMFYMAQMEMMVNRDRAVLDDWRRCEPPIIPTPLYFDKRGRGMYSESQTKYLSKILHRLDTGTLLMTYEDLRLLLHKTWSETFSERNLTTRIREVLHNGTRSEGEGRKVRQGRYANRAEL